jgi:CBS-domain-containing membrane protein
LDQEQFAAAENAPALDRAGLTLNLMVIRNEGVSTIMSTELTTVQENAKISVVRRILAENRFHHVPVLSGKRIIGIISSSDLLRISLNAFGADQRAVDAMLDSQFTLQSVMTFAPETLKVRRTIRDAAKKLSTGKFHSLPIVTDRSELVGIVTTTDIVRYLLEQFRNGGPGQVPPPDSGWSS